MYNLVGQEVATLVNGVVNATDSYTFQWNANNVKDTTVRGHGDEIVPVWECHADCPAHILDNQSGVSKSSDAVRRNKREDKKLTMGGKIHAKGGSETHGFKDKGGASRFFYCPKTAKKEKTCNGLVENTHPTVKPIGLIEWVLKLGSGTTAVAAHRQNIDCIGIDNNADYLDIAEQRLQNDWRLTEDAISPIIKRV